MKKADIAFWLYVAFVVGLLVGTLSERWEHKRQQAGAWTSWCEQHTPFYGTDC
jgi:hypothetical protein